MIWAAEIVNPEAFISATVAANAAETAASNAFFVSMIIVGILLALGAVLMFMLYKMAQVLKNQDDFIAEIREKRIAEQGRLK